MRIPERAHWAAWRLYLSLSQNVARVRPLSSCSHVNFGVAWRDSYVPPSPLLASSSVLRNVWPILRSPYSTGRVEKEDAKNGPVGVSSSSGWSKEEVVNWPNAISMGRLLSGPLLAWMIANDMVKPALVGLVLAGGSDWLDGYMARRQGINSVLGSYLDPLADKVLVGCVAVSMAYSGLLHPALVTLIVARDGVLLVGSFVYRAYNLRWKWSGFGEFFKINAGGVEKVEPLFISKVNMVLQLGLIGTALVLPAMEIQDTYSVIPILSWSVVATTSASWIGYAWVYLRRPTTAAVTGGLTQVSRKVEKSS